MRLSEAAAMTGGNLQGRDTDLLGVSIDSRTLVKGDLFFAIRGDRYDGHNFIEQAEASGAVGAVVDSGINSVPTIPLLHVRDTGAALRALASSWRSRLPTTIAAVAGSNGKTTTKEMVARIFQQYAGNDAVLATEGNLNNGIGVPLTLLRLRSLHRYAAIEIGMNHFGEISQLAEIVRPEIGLVTNAQREHLEFIGSSKDAAVENACLYENMSNDATVVVNFDDPHKAVFMRSVGRRRCVSFGLSGDAEITAHVQASDSGSLIRVCLPGDRFDAQLHIHGLHNVRNALAAVGVAHAAGIPVDSMRRGLEAFRPYRGRMDWKSLPGGVFVIDDTYNANPDSVVAAIDVLSSARGTRILVLGDMGEVGGHRDKVHREVGECARERGVDVLFSIGDATTETIASFGERGMHFDSVEALLSALIPLLTSDVTLLVKGSRFMRMERIVQGVFQELSDGRRASHAA